MLKVQHIKESNIYCLSIMSPRKESDEVEFLETLNKVVETTKFGLILDVEGEKAFSHNAKVELAKWFKTNRKRLADECVGFARVEVSETKLEKQNSEAMKKAIPCPYKVFENIDQALYWLKN